MTQEQAINSLMTENRTFPPPEAVRKNAYVSSTEQYTRMWERSVKDPDGFWPHDGCGTMSASGSSLRVQ